ncbi:hypothetical protein FH972_005159 [Carpinus fangiana]|uniref:Uncharacterized protein n=1 Tax=Carpinus fangiana TaxID=176857 RepID=A0A5N6QND8_9ROSI|nr:hypothetical protein FH972_005159 [Carpinus fangiana]
MGVRLPVVALAKQIVRRSALTASRAVSTSSDVPRGFFAVYVGEKQMQRFVVPVSYLNQPSFQDLLRKAEEEFGFNHPTGGLTIPCRVDTFIDLNKAPSLPSQNIICCEEVPTCPSSKIWCAIPYFAGDGQMQSFHVEALPNACMDYGNFGLQKLAAWST